MGGLTEIYYDFKGYKGRGEYCKGFESITIVIEQSEYAYISSNIREDFANIL